jgi:hypothetical protein
MPENIESEEKTPEQIKADFLDLVNEISGLVEENNPTALDFAVQRFSELQDMWTKNDLEDDEEIVAQYDEIAKKMEPIRIQLNKEKLKTGPPKAEA